LVDLVALKERWFGLDWLTMGKGHDRHGMRRMPPQEGGAGRSVQFDRGHAVS